MSNGPMLKNPRAPKAYAKHSAGCSCCNTRGERKAAKKAARGDEKRGWKRDAEAPDDPR